MHALNTQLSLWTFAIDCEYCGHIVPRLCYCSYCNLSVYATLKENTRNYNVKKFQFSYYQLIVFVYDARCTCTTVPITSRTLPPALGTVLDQSRTGLATHGTVVYTLPWRVIPVSSVYNILCSPVLAGLLWSREQRGRWHRS